MARCQRTHSEQAEEWYIKACDADPYDAGIVENFNNMLKRMAGKSYDGFDAFRKFQAKKAEAEAEEQARILEEEARNEGGRGTGVGVASPRRGEDLRIAGARAVEILVVEGEEVGQEVNLEPKGITKSSTTGSFLYLPFLGLLVYGAAEVRTRSGNVTFVVRLCR